MTTATTGGIGLAGADREQLDKLSDARRRIKEQLARKVVGQEEVIDQLLCAIFARGHCLLEGASGVGKTRIITSLAETLSLEFNRIQFTPDLMPSDITGTEILTVNHETGQREFRFLKGPIFANMVLAAEINRTPPKTQAALMEAMEERQISCGGKKHPTPEPFFVLATKNSIDQEGTYPLPAAQLDRFMFKVRVEYPDVRQERTITQAATTRPNVTLEKVLSREELLGLQQLVRRMPISDETAAYALRIARATRLKGAVAHEAIRDNVSWGVGPRATQALIIGGKARAILNGRREVTRDDIFALAHPVLRHRLVVNFTAEAEGVTTDMIIDRYLKTIPGGPPTEEERATPLWQRIIELFRG